MSLKHLPKSLLTSTYPTSICSEGWLIKKLPKELLKASLSKMAVQRKLTTKTGIMLENGCFHSNVCCFFLSMQAGNMLEQLWGAPIHDSWCFLMQMGLKRIIMCSAHIATLCSVASANLKLKILPIGKKVYICMYICIYIIQRERERDMWWCKVNVDFVPL